MGTATADDPHKFAGMYLDGESGLYHTWARMYDPSLGRWLAPDPIHGDANEPGSLNRYTYVGNNPVNFIDPLGLDPLPEYPAPSAWYDEWFNILSSGRHANGQCTTKDGMAVPCQAIMSNTECYDTSDGRSCIQVSAGFNDWVLMNVGDMTKLTAGGPPFRLTGWRVAHPLG